MKPSNKFLPVSKNTSEVFVVIQDKVIFHDENSAAPYFSKKIIGIYFSKKEAADKKKEIISRMKDTVKCCYVFIENHYVY